MVMKSNMSENGLQRQKQFQWWSCCSWQPHAIAHLINYLWYAAYACTKKIAAHGLPLRLLFLWIFYWFKYSNEGKLHTQDSKKRDQNAIFAESLIYYWKSFNWT